MTDFKIGDTVEYCNRSESPRGVVNRLIHDHSVQVKCTSTSDRSLWVIGDTYIWDKGDIKLIDPMAGAIPEGYELATLGNNAVLWTHENILTDHGWHIQLADWNAPAGTIAIVRLVKTKTQPSPEALQEVQEALDAGTLHLEGGRLV